MTNGIEPVAKTGGRVYDFEDHVAVFFLLQMIAGNALLGRIIWSNYKALIGKIVQTVR